MTETSHQLWKKSVIGKELTEAEAQELYLISKRETFRKDEVLFAEGDPAVSLHLIVEGEIDIEKTAEGGKVSAIATLVPGVIVGEMSLLTNEDRSAAARVRTDEALVLTIAWEDLQKMMKENQSAAYKLIYSLARLLAHRLKRINLKVADLMASSDEGGSEKLEEFARFKQKLFRDWSF